MEGEALLMSVERFEGIEEKELVARFNEARAEAYADLLAELETFERTLDDDETDNVSPLKILDKLRRRLTELRRIDFFNSPQGVETMTKLTALEGRLTPASAESDRITVVDKSDYQGKTWVTRPQPHVDRLASAWLIRRFIDPGARIRYRRSVKKGEVSFDMEGADFGHTGSLCTFETLVAAFSLDDAALTPLAQIVHELDLRDERYLRSEVPGLEVLLDGWLAVGLSDEELEERGVQLFEGLYISFSEAGRDRG